MIAACHVAECRATSQGRPSGGRTSAGRARLAGEVKAPAVPLTTTRAKIGPTAVGPEAT